MARFKRKITKDLFEPRVSADELRERRVVIDREVGTISTRIASFNDAHSGFKGAIKSPRNVNVEAAHVGHAELEGGETLPVGTLPMHTMHAGQDLTAAHAASWYENTGQGVARVRYSIDDEGIRADGVLFDDVTDADLDRLTASAPSGDWRCASLVRQPEDFEHAQADFAGACIVSMPGYSGTYSQSPATPLRLVASADSQEILLTDLEDAAEQPTCGDGVCCGGVCKQESEDPGNGVSESASEAPEVDLGQLQAAATLLAQHASVLGLDEDTTQALTAASSQPDPDADSIELLRADVNALYQIVHDAILAM